MRTNPIGWATDTINPISGCSNCDENGLCQGKFKCYAESFARRLAGKERKHPDSTGYPTEPGLHFAPTFHWDKHWGILNLPERGKPKRVFLDSMSDWFCEGVEPEWVHHTIDVLWQVQRHHFLVLTKRPERILEVLHCKELPPNLWLGVSVTCQADLWRISMLKESIPSDTKRFISFEPLLGPVYQEGQKLGVIDWVIIGAQSGPGKTVPEAKWVSDICWAADDADIPVFLKDNLLHIVGGSANMPPYNRPMRREFPEAMW
jgi:protein gp37